jgi:hypothetical protein
MVVYEALEEERNGGVIERGGKNSDGLKIGCSVTVSIIASQI